MAKPQTVESIERIISRYKIEYFSLRICDLPGRWLHFTIPAKRFVTNGKLAKKFFTQGVAFDGSSLEGFKSIEQSDTLAIPDINSAVVDPLAPAPTLAFACNLAEPESIQSYWRDPRAVAIRAESHLKKTGIADIANFGPEIEFFIFDEANWEIREGFSCLNVVSREGGVGNYEDDSNVYRVRKQEGYFVMPPYDYYYDLREEMMRELEKAGIEVERDTHERATAGSAEIDITFDSLLRMADKVLLFKHIIKNVAHSYDRMVTFMPKPLYGHNGSGMHTHLSLWKDDKPVFYDSKGGYHQLSKTAMYFIGGILEHAPALAAITSPSVNSYKRLVPGFEAPTTIAFGYRNRSTCVRIPGYPATPSSRRLELRIPDPSSNPYLCFSAMLMAGLDGVARKIDPIKAGFGPLEVSGYELKNATSSQFTPGSLEESLNALERDHDFLKDGNVFGNDFINLWIEYKREEIKKVAEHPTAPEFDRYFDC